MIYTEKVSCTVWKMMIVAAVSLHKPTCKLVKIAAVSWHSLRRFIKPAPVNQRRVADCSSNAHWAFSFRISWLDLRLHLTSWLAANQEYATFKWRLCHLHCYDTIVVSRWDLQHILCRWHPPPPPPPPIPPPPPPPPHPLDTAMACLIDLIFVHRTLCARVENDNGSRRHLAECPQLIILLNLAQTY